MIELVHVNKIYNEGKANEVRAIKDVSFSLPSTGLLALLGPSGSGKSTLLSLLGALLSPTSGEILYNGIDIGKYSEKEKDRYRAEVVSFLFQEDNLIEYLNVYDNARLKSKKGKEEVEKVLSSLGILDLARKMPSELSGGEKERTAIARCLLSESKILLADEPTASIDHERAKEVMEILKGLAKEKLVILVSHDEALCFEYADSYLRILDGEIKESHLNKIEENEAKNPAIPASLPKRIPSRASKHAKKKKGYTILIFAFSFIGFLSASLAISLSFGAGEFVDRVERQVLKFSPFTISSYYEDISSITLFRDPSAEEKIEEGGLKKGNETSLVSSLHSNIITKELIEELEASKTETTRIVYNGGQTYSFIHEGENGYELYDAANKNSLSDYVDTFFGSKSVVGTRLYEEEEFLSHFTWLSGSFPRNEDEVIVLLDRIGHMNGDLFDILQAKEGDSYDSLVGKSFYFASDKEIFVKTDEKEVSGRFLKDQERLDAESLDARATINYLVEGVNAYYDGDEKTLDSSMDSLRALFNEEEETRRLSAYSKIKNPDALANIVDDESRRTKITVAGVARCHSDTVFDERNLGLLFSPAALERFQKENSLSSIAKELPRHLCLLPSSLSLQMAGVYGYAGSVTSPSSSLSESAILNLLMYFEDRKLFSVNNEVNSIEVYGDSVADKEAAHACVRRYNEDKDEAFAIIPIDLSRMLLSYFDNYFGILYGALYGISVISMVVCSILSLSLTFNMVYLRIREIGIYRASGYSKGYVFALMEIESVAISFLGASLGIALSLALIPMLNALILNVAQDAVIANLLHLPLAQTFLLLGLSLLSSFLSSFIPVFNFARKKPGEIVRR